MASAGSETNRGQSKSTAPLALWTPQPGPQANAIAADWCPIIFYGGGKFSGKSDFLLGDYLQDLETYREHWQGIIFRRALTEFTELKLRSNELFPKIGGIWQEQKSQWIFPLFGTPDQVPTLRFRYLKNLSEISQYEGHSYPWVGVDELGDWEDKAPFFRLLTCNRYGRFPIPNKRLRATGNPGGRGHSWIRDYFTNPAPGGSKLLWDDELKMHYMFILGTYRDNKIGLGNDPGYPNRLNRAGSKALVRALKEGDFTIVAGAFFSFDSRNVIAPFEIPKWWTRYMSMDWGACNCAEGGDPFSVGWWCIADGDTCNGTIPYFKRGTLIRYREWYGGRINERVTVKFVADGIKLHELGDAPISYRLAGGDIKKKLDQSGPSIFEMFGNHGIHFLRADMNRAAGWLKMDEDIRGDGPRGEEVPRTVVFDTCTDSIEIIPHVQHSVKNANDIEESHDDLPDEWRYGHMGRATVADKPVEEMKFEQKFKAPSMNQLFELQERATRRR